MTFLQFWDILGSGASGGTLGKLWDCLGKLWGDFGSLWHGFGRLGEGLGRLGEALGRLWESLRWLGETWGSFGGVWARPPPARPKLYILTPDQPALLANTILSIVSYILDISD